MFEEASLETSSSLVIIWKILLPNLRTGIAAAFVLSFAEAWNMVEQPLVLLDDMDKYPFSLLFRTITENDPGMLFTSAVMALILPALLYAFFQDELAEGLDAGNLNFTW
jgi:multiple sugar transport system permease protein